MILIMVGTGALMLGMPYMMVRISPLCSLVLQLIFRNLRVEKP